MKPCFCGRAPSGFAFLDFNPMVRDRRPIVHCCSMACMDLVKRNKGMPPTRDEARAVEQASGAVGAYLEEIGKTDLAQMTAEEWQGFVGHAFVCVAAEVRAICDADIPF